MFLSAQILEIKFTHKGAKFCDIFAQEHTRSENVNCLVMICLFFLNLNVMGMNSVQFNFICIAAFKIRIVSRRFGRDPELEAVFLARILLKLHNDTILTM